jgi:nucleotide-binding universal stress UspA family protein
VSVPSTGAQPVGRIVVGVDGTTSSEQALRWAAAHAGRTRQDVHAVIAWHLAVAYDGPVVDDYDWSGEAAGALSKTVENVLDEPEARRVVQHVTEGHPAGVLVDASRDADLLVVGSRGHGGFAGLLLGSVSQHVVVHAACPVVVVHGRRPATGRVVVGVDGSPGSERALHWAVRQARSTGSVLHAVLAWEVPLAYGLTARPDPDWAAHGQHTLATAVADALGEGPAPEVVQDVVEDSPAEALLRAAEDADLLVVGSRGRGGFSGMLLGSVSQQVAAHAACPVVVHRGAGVP